MNKYHFSKKSFLGGLVALGMVAGAGAQVDQVAAAGGMADIFSMAVQAQAEVASASLSGSVDEVSAARNRAAALNNALGAAVGAYEALDAAIATGDTTAAESASADLVAAIEAAKQIMNGDTPAVVVSEQEVWKASKANTGGGPAQPYDPPNINDVPWKSQGIRSYYNSLFGVYSNARSYGSGQGFGDSDATQI